MQQTRRQFLNHTAQKTAVAALILTSPFKSRPSLASGKVSTKNSKLSCDASKPSDSPDIKISIDDKNTNSILLNWSKCPTNIFRLWMPEIFGFTNDKDRLYITTPIGWEQTGLKANTPTVNSNHKHYSFQWQLTLTPTGENVIIDLTLKNTSDKPLPPMFSINGCLNFFMAPDFMDSTGRYTFFRTRKGWQSLYSIRRPQALLKGTDPYHILAQGYNDPEDSEAIKDVRTISSLCVRESRTRKYVVGYAWDSVFRLDINFNRLHCIHSVPALGPLAPGQTSKHKGYIFFRRASKDDLLKACKKAGLV